MSVIIKDLDKEIKTIDGKDIKYSNEEPKTFFRKVFYRSALNGDPNKETPEEVVDRWDLAKRIKESGAEVEISEKEFLSLRKDIARSFAVEIGGQVVKHLDICKIESLKKESLKK